MFNWLFPSKRSVENPNTPITTDALERFNQSSTAITRHNCFALPAFARGVTLISNTVARCPTFVMKKEGENKVRDEDHPAYYPLRHQANEIVTSYVWFREATAQSIWNGNSFTWIDRSTNPYKLYLLDPEQTFITIEHDANSIRPSNIFYTTSVEGSYFTFPASEIIHFKGLGNSNGLVGMRLLDYAKEALGLGINSQQYANTYFKRGGALYQFVELPGYIESQEKIEQFRRGIEASHADINKAHRIALLQGGAKLNRFSISNDEAQMIESRRLSIVDVANLLSLPAHKLNSEINTSYASLSEENLALLSDTYDAYFTNFEGELENKLLLESQKHTRSHLITFERRALLRGATQQETAALIDQLNNGLLSWEEVRQLLDKPIDSDGTFRRPANIMVEGEEAPEPPPEAPAASPEAPEEDIEAEDQEPEEDAQEDTRSKQLLHHTINRLLKRIVKSNKPPFEHRSVWEDALHPFDGHEDALEDLQQEWLAVLPEQRAEAMHSHTEEIVEKLWN